MEIVRYADRRDRAVHVGVRDAGRIAAVEGIDRIAELLRMPLVQLRGQVEQAAGGLAGDAARSEADVLLLPPIDGGTEVWASGVTYERSMAARMEESASKSIYELVYDAERPELFLKAVAWRVVTDGEPVAIRADSELNVPEPELGVVANSAGEIAGYVVANDMSSRSIEGENPLYLPQAKVYAGSCALSFGIRPAWEVPDAGDLAITLRIERNGATVWSGETSTARMRRPLTELVEYALLGDAHPDGVVLATGTGIIPEMSFTLAAGDRVVIEIRYVGTLSNPVIAGRSALTWLVDARTDPFAREAQR